MNTKTQMVKGFLNGLVLKVLESESLYTADIINKLNEQGYTGLSEGTIYPLLLRLENNNLLKSKRVYNTLGPSRKIYSITKDGQVELVKIIEIWEEFSQICNGIFLGGKTNE